MDQDDGHRVWPRGSRVCEMHFERLPFTVNRGDEVRVSVQMGLDGIPVELMEPCVAKAMKPFDRWA